MSEELPPLTYTRFTEVDALHMWGSPALNVRRDIIVDTIAILKGDVLQIWAALRSMSEKLSSLTYARFTKADMLQICAALRSMFEGPSSLTR